MQVKGKNLDIEFLRAVALLMILLQHAEVLVPGSHQLYWNMRAHLNLWGGVDLFFCVSGFVITRALIQTFPPNPGQDQYLISRRLGWKNTALAFWVRRAWRLWPSAWLWIVLSIGCAVLINRSGVFGTAERMTRDGLAAFFHLANFHWANCYPLAFQTCNMVPAQLLEARLPTGWNLAVYWSLSLEEQFYFLMPLLLFFVPKRWIAAAAALGLLALALLHRPPLSWLWFVRVDAILIGVMIGWFTHTRLCINTDRDAAEATHAAPAWLDRKWLIYTLTIGILLCIGWLGEGQRAAHPGTITAIALCSGVLVWIASQGREALIPANRIARAIFVWIGNRSYCLYLVHMVGYFLTIELWYRAGGAHTHWQWFGRYATAAVLTLLMAEITARWIETPLRQKGRARAQYWLEKS
ncbi:MAG: acyltransferase [Burkholderiaceae bacterium]|jgi:peptidoglycan/LPS O-acetylase OafA/YrhL|nr:acyltransferase [Burkholderiaceae bacterium]